MERKSYLKYDWDNVSIIPAPLTDIDSRKDVSARDENNKLPLFISPMDTVVDEYNAEYFLNLGYEVCLPRGIMYEERLKDCFFSYGLDEIIEMMNTKSFIPNKILIDIANGHMSKLYNVAKDIKENYNKVLMIGNIANPETYRLYSEIGVDYIRCGIGGGCFTPNSLVETENGLKRIVDITVGDKVRTHKNRFRKVTQLHTFEKNEKLLYINDIECTKNHEFYVIFKSDKVHVTNENINEYAFWLEASELDKDKYLLIKF